MFRVLFTFPSQYWFTIGLSGVFSLSGWSRLIHTGFHVPRTTQDTTIDNYIITCTGLSPSTAKLSNLFQFCKHRISRSYNPNRSVNLLVWAPARSLAATSAITVVFFSSGYLDVSVLRVRPPNLNWGYYTFNVVGCPIRISTDQFVCADPRSFSQLITSFVASESLGIPHTPLISLCLLPNLLFTISSKLL